MISGSVLGTCLIPIMIGGFSDGPSKAALSAGVVMALVAFVVSPVPGGHLGHIATQGTFEAALIQALAVIPAMMALGLVGYGVRYGLGRLWAARVEPSVAHEGRSGPERAQAHAYSGRRDA